MSRNWPVVSLGEVITHRKEFITIDDAVTYKRCRVQLHAQGIVLRDRVPGAEIKTKQQQVCRAGDFLVAEIDAKVGGFGIVPADLEGAVVSSHYFLFDVNEERLDRRFLDYFCRTRLFREQVTAQGSTNYAAIRPSNVLGYTIWIPALQEQGRIVARVEELAAKLEAAANLRSSTAKEIDDVVSAVERQLWPIDDLHSAPNLECVTTFLARGRQSKQGESNHYLIKTQHVQMDHYVRTNLTLDADAAQSVQPDAIVHSDDILIACSAAGCLGRVAYYEDMERVTSCDTHIAIARADMNVILPRYLYAYLRGATGQLQLRSRERGDWQREKVGFRFTELNIADLRQVPVPLPTLDDQRRMLMRLDAILSKVDALRILHSRSAVELDAVFHSTLDRAFAGIL